MLNILFLPPCRLMMYLLTTLSPAPCPIGSSHKMLKSGKKEMFTPAAY